MRRFPVLPSKSFWLAIACGAILSPVAHAQLPTVRLTSVFPPGGKQGATVDVTLTGTDFDEVSQLYFDHPGLKAEPIVEMKDGKPVPAPAAGPAKFRITIAADTPLGMHDVRAVGRFGVSNPRTFVVGDAVEVNETEPNNTVQQATRVLSDVLPAITINGQVNGATDIDHYVLAARAGQRVLIACQAQQIDSRMDGRLALYGPSGRIIASSSFFDGKDPFLDVSITTSGDYTLAVTDRVFDGSPEYFYRVAIGTLPYIDYIMPPAAAPGAPAEFTLFGRGLPGGQPSGMTTTDGRPLDQLKVQIAVPNDPLAIQRLAFSGLVYPRESMVDGFEYRLTTPQGSSNSVLLGVTNLPIVGGAEPNDAPDKAQKVTAPCEVFGQFQSASDVDWYSFTAKANEVFVFEVISQKAGFPTDSFLLLRRASDGAEIASADDDATNPVGLRFAMNSDDPVLQSPALAEGEYQIAVRDLYGAAKGGPRHVYRLRIRPVQPDFRLVVMPGGPMQPNVAQQPDALHLRQGGNQHLDVYAARRDGFNGEITVAAEGLPAGVTSAPVTIGPGQVYAPIIFSAADNAPVGVGAVKITGSAKIGDQQVSREARPGVLTWAFDPNQQRRPPSRVARSIAIAVREGAPYRVVATPEKIEHSRGLPLKLKLQVTRRGDFKANVDGVTAVALPPNAQNAAVAIPADKNEAELTLNMPPNVPVGTYTVALRGNAPAVPFTKDPEGKNKQNIQVSDISTPVIVTITDPLKMAVNPSPAAVKKGANVEVTATVTRQGGYTGPVQLQFISLPGNVTSAAVTVAPEAKDAKLTIAAAANAANGSFSNVLLRATANVNGQNINIDAAFTLNVE